MTKMTAALKGLHSPDIFDLSSYLPSDEEAVGFLLQAMFGPENEDGEESFDIFVCNSKWIHDRATEIAILPGQHLLIVEDYKLQLVESFLCEYAKSCVGGNWQEVAAKLSRIGRWEFEDYNP